MNKTLTVASILLAGAMIAAPAQAGKKASSQKQMKSDDFLGKLVEAALPKSATPEGLLNSGSFGVSLFLLCEASGAQKDDVCRLGKQ